MKESLGLEKKTTVSKALAESNFRENKTELEVLLWCSRPVASTWDLLPPPQNLPSPVQLQMLSQLKITQNVLPE